MGAYNGAEVCELVGIFLYFISSNANTTKPIRLTQRWQLSSISEYKWSTSRKN